MLPDDGAGRRHQPADGWMTRSTATCAIAGGDRQISWLNGYEQYCRADGDPEPVSEPELAR